MIIFLYCYIDSINLANYSSVDIFCRYEFTKITYLLPYLNNYILTNLKIMKKYSYQDQFIRIHAFLLKF